MKPNRPFALLLALAFACPSFARGHVWDFLGYTLVDSDQNHGIIEVARRDRLFRSIQVRVEGEPIFFDRVVVHFVSGSTQEFSISGRIFPGGRDYIIELPGELRALQSVELWYYREFWDRRPRISLYGVRLPDPATESSTPPH